MSSQLGTPRPTQPSPYANIPGYRTDEPANSAWNRVILSYRSSGVPYSIETTRPPPTQTRTSQGSLGSTPVLQPSRSTNPQLESAILESFARNPAGLASAGTEKGSYLYGLYGKGVLTSEDFGKINVLSEKYNKEVEAKNAKAQSDYQKALKDYTSEVLTQAKSEKAAAIHIYDQSGNQLDSIPVRDAETVLPLALQSFSGKDVYASTKSKQEIQNLQSLARQNNMAAQKQLKDSLNQYTSQGYVIRITDSSGKVVKETSGARAYHDVLQAQKQIGAGMSFFPYYPARTNLANVQRSDFFQDPLGTAGQFLTGAFQTGVTVAAQQIGAFYSAAKAPSGKPITTPTNFLGVSVPLPNENFGPAFVSAIKQEGKQFVSSGVNTLGQVARVAPYLGIPIKGPLQGFIAAVPVSWTKTQPLAPEAQAFVQKYSSPTAFDVLSGQKTSGFTQASLAGSAALAIFLTAEPLVKAVPLRGAGLGIGIRSIETGKEIATPSRTLLLGYGGEKSIPLLSYVGGKIVKGAPKPSQVVPNEFEITSFGRGTQIAAKASGWETKYLTSKGFIKDLEARGKVLPGTSEALAAHESIFKTSKGAKDETPKTMEELIPSKFTVESKEAVYTQLGKQQGPLSFLRLSGRVGKLGGSGALFLSLPQRFQKAMGQPKDIDVHTSSIFGESFAAPRLTSKLAKKANVAIKSTGEIIEGKTAYIAGEREITALGKLEGKALEIPNPKSKGIENLEGSSTGFQESKLFGQKISTGTLKVRVSKKNKQSVMFATGQKQLADQIRTSSSIQTLSTITEQMKSNPVELAKGAKEKLKGTAALLPPAFRVKDLVRETLKTEHYAEQFEKKGELGKAITLRENIKTVKGYAEQIYKVDWAKLETEVSKEPITTERVPSIIESARSKLPSAAKGFRTSAFFIERTPSSSTSQRPSGIKSIGNISSSILPSVKSGRSSSTRSRFSSIMGSSGISSARPSGRSSVPSKPFSSIMSTPSRVPSKGPSGYPSKSPKSTPSSPLSSMPSSPFSSISSPTSGPPSSTPSLPPSSEFNPPPVFDKKKFGFPGFWLPNPTEGPSGPVFSRGLKRSYVGNVPEFQFTGMYNRIETVYGRGGGIPRERVKLGKKSYTSFNAFGSVSGKPKKSKSLSNKYTKLI